MYEIIKITLFPVHDSTNVFTLIKTTCHFLTIDKQNRHYLLLSEHDLKECIQNKIYVQTELADVSCTRRRKKLKSITVPDTSTRYNSTRYNSNRYNVLDNFIGITILIVFYIRNAEDIY